MGSSSQRVSQRHEVVPTIFRSPFPDVDIPDTPLTPYVLSRNADVAGKAALIDGPSGRTLTHGELKHLVERAAAGLAQRGLRKGDVLAIFSPNIPEYAVAFHGTAMAGGVNTTINPRYTVDELVYQLEDSGARFLVTVPPFLDKALEAQKRTDVEEIFVLGEAEGATPFTEVLATDAPVPDVAIDPAEDLVALPYSSGTTGLPKGVMLTHRNLVANLAQSEAVERVTQDDVLVGVLPFYHIYGLTLILNFALYNGATVVTMPQFDMEQFLGLIEKHGITRAHLVPPIILGLAKHPVVDRFDLSSLRMIVSGAAPLGENVAQAAADRLGCGVKQGYGLTETSPVTHVNPDDANRGGTVGPALPNTEVRLVSVDDGSDQGPGERGEILIRGPQVMKGYLGNPEATGGTLDADGWLHTGDVGICDEDGYLQVVDRVKELIKFQGFQVPPAELEAILLDHPAIADAAVIPHPDEEAGEIPKAFIVKQGDVSEQEVMDFVAERVTNYKKIRLVEFVDEIPKTASGKILRRVLVERERENA